MPSRVIRGEIVTSRSLANVSELAESMFFRLLLLVDDYGRYDGDPEILAAHLYPRRRSVTTADVCSRLDELVGADGNGGPVRTYQVDGRRYLQLVNWEKHRGKSRRGSTSRWPDPPNFDDTEAETQPAASPEIRGDPRGSKGTHGDPPGVARSRGSEESRSRGEVNPPAASPRERGKTQAPTELTEDQRAALVAWWRSRKPEDLVSSLSLGDLERYEETCLAWFRGDGRRKKNWVSVIQVWIRKDLEDAKARASPRQGRLEVIGEALKASEDRDRERARRRRIEAGQTPVTGGDARRLRAGG